MLATLLQAAASDCKAAHAAHAADSVVQITPQVANIPVPEGAAAVEAFLDQLRTADGALPAGLKVKRPQRTTWQPLAGTFADLLALFLFSVWVETLTRIGGGVQSNEGWQWQSPTVVSAGAFLPVSAWVE